VVRIIAYLVGSLMLTEGLITTFRPRLGFRLWEDELRTYFPSSVDEVTQEYSHLSNRAIRFMAVLETTLAILLLWLASRSRDGGSQ